MESELLTIKEASEALKISPITLYEHVRNRKIESIRVFGSVRISKEALNKYIQDNTVLAKTKRGK